MKLTIEEAVDNKELLAHQQKVSLVHDIAQEEQEPAFAQASRELDKANKLKAEYVKVEEAPKHEEEGKLPKMAEGAKKMYLEESLFEDVNEGQEQSDFIVYVDVDGDSSIKSGEQFDIDAEFAELRDMNDDELLAQDLIGAAQLYRDDEGLVHLFEITFINGKKDIVEKAAQHYIDDNTELSEAINTVENSEDIESDTENDINEDQERESSAIDFLTDVKNGHGWVVVDDIDQKCENGGYHCTAKDVLNIAKDQGFKFEQSETHGLILAAESFQGLSDLQEAFEAPTEAEKKIIAKYKLGLFKDTKPNEEEARVIAKHRLGLFSESL